MKAQAERRQSANNSTAADVAQRVGTAVAAHQPTANAQTLAADNSIQNIGDNDHTHQLKTYQDMVDVSPRVKQLKGYQHMADNGVKQLKGKTANATPGTPVVQRWEWPSWLPWGKKKEDPYANLNTNDRRLALLGDDIHRDEQAGRKLQDRGQRSDREGLGNERLLADYERNAHEATSSPLHQTAAEKTGQVGGFAAFAGGLTTSISHLAGNGGAGIAGEWTKVGGQGLGVVGSLASAATGVHDIATSQDKKKDKALKGVDVAGSLGNAVYTGANGLGTLSGVLPASGALSTAASVMAPAIAPAAIVKSGADVVSGLATGGLAHYRSNKLEELGQQAMEKQAIIKFAQDNQWIKAKANYAKAAGGAVGVAGGALLLAAGLSNPVGWGLLAAAGAIALGVGLYKMYKKHESGNKLLENRQSLRRDNIVVEDAVPRRGFGDLFKTEAMRRHDDVRGKIATNLRDSEGTSGFDDEPNTASKIISNIGVSEKPAADEGSVLLDAMDLDETEKARHERAKAIAKGLDF